MAKVKKYIKTKLSQRIKYSRNNFLNVGLLKKSCCIYPYFKMRGDI